MNRMIVLLLSVAIFPALLCSADNTRLNRTGSVRDTSAFSVYFRLDSFSVDSLYMENGAVLDTVAAILSDPHFQDSLFITGAASLDGRDGYNSILSRKRAEAVRDYLISLNPGLPGGKVQVDYVGEDWTGLKNLIISDPDFPNKSIVLWIIDGNYRNDTKEMVLKVFPEMYSYIKEKHLKYTRSATLKFPTWHSFDGVPYLASPQGRISSQGGAEIKPHEFQRPSVRKPVLAFRTNLLLPASNVGMSIPVGNSWSVGMDYYFPWIWPPEKNRWCIELLGVGLEARYWFGRSRTWQQRLTGHSVGLGVNAGY